MSSLFKKGFAFAIIILFIGLVITPICTAQSVNQSANTTENNNKFWHYFVKGNIRIIYNVTCCYEPIIPLTGEHICEISVSYRITGILANVITRILAGRRYMEIKLAVEDVPEYAAVMVSPSVVTLGISAMWESEQCYIHVSVDENAPAYETSYFTLKATSASILKGPLGFVPPLIHAVEHAQDIPFVPGYIPIIDVNPETYSIETPPGEITELPFHMKNLANGLTMIESEIIHSPSDDWWCYIQPETILDVDETKDVPLFIMAPQNFTGHETIELAFTGSYYYDPSQHTPMYVFHIIVSYNP